MTEEIQFLERIFDMMIEDILETSDEKIIKEAEEDGVDVNKAVEHAKAIIEKCRDKLNPCKKCTPANDSECDFC